jgi:hypothetical protein
MRSVCLMFILASLAPGAAYAENVAQRESMVGSCWSTIVVVEEVRNFLLLCIRAERVESLAFFPNPAANQPTICRQVGEMTAPEAATRLIRLQAGNCENGRVLGGSELRCSPQSSDELKCVDENDYEFNFSRESPEKYGAAVPRRMTSVANVGSTSDRL